MSPQKDVSLRTVGTSIEKIQQIQFFFGQQTGGCDQRGTIHFNNFKNNIKN